MKKLIKLISVALILTFSFLTLAACAANPSSQSNSDSSAESGSGTESGKTSDRESSLNINTDVSSDNTQAIGLPNNAYAILHSGAYAVRVIMPDKPTDAEKAVYTKLRTSLKSKTGVDVRTETDYMRAKRGYISLQLRNPWIDNTHLNEDGYYALAYGVFEKGKELGYW